MPTNEEFYRSLYRIRRVEEEIVKVYPSDKIRSPVHLSIGQEAVSVGVCEALKQEDIVFGSYRCHAMYLAKGGDLNQMIAELYGKATGCSKGKGGSMHLVDIEHGIMGASAVVGTTIPEAIGYAYGLKVQKSNAVVVIFLGDGASEEGVFYESLNFAALKSLPIIFVCENNLYAIYTHQKYRQKNTEIYQRVRTFGLPAERVEDDIFQIHEQVSSAVDAIRSGTPGPFFFECMTYRWKEHVGPNEDFVFGHRTLEEAQPWMDRDQVEKVGALLDTGDRLRIENEVQSEVDEAFEYAEKEHFYSGVRLLRSPLCIPFCLVTVEIPADGTLSDCFILLEAIVPSRE